MVFQEPKLEFVRLELSADIMTRSKCISEEIRASYSMCGCTDGIANGLVDSNNICAEGFVWMKPKEKVVQPAEPSTKAAPQNPVGFDQVFKQ